MFEEKRHTFAFIYKSKLQNNVYESNPVNVHEGGVNLLLWVTECRFKQIPYHIWMRVIVPNVF